MQKKTYNIHYIKKEQIFYWKLYKYANYLDWFYIVMGILFTLFGALLHPIFFVFYGIAIENFVNYTIIIRNVSINVDMPSINHAFSSILNQLGLKIAVLGLFCIFFQYLGELLFCYSSLRQIFRIRRKLFKKILQRNLGWFDESRTKSFVTAISENLTIIEDAIGRKARFFLYNGLVFISCFIWSLAIGLKLTLACLICYPISLVFIMVFSRFFSKQTEKELTHHSEASLIAEEVLSSIRTVVEFNGQEKESKRYIQQIKEVKKINIIRNIINSIITGISWFFFYIGSSISIWYGAELMLHDESTYSTAIISSIIYNSIYGSYHFLVAYSHIGIFGNACGAAKEIFNIMEEDIKYPSKRKKLDNIKGDVLFKNVDFSYPSRENVKVLNGINFRMKFGETIAFVGKSGCGKSTCIQLLLKFYNPTNGQIFIDETDVTSLDTVWWREQIGLVEQEPTLFSSTISENIRFGKLNADQEEIEKYAKQAKIHNFIKNLPNGYQTLIGENGVQLSGGQKQKIAIARALIRKPSILLLDEATSALDTKSEFEFLKSFHTITENCTTIIVAHRLSTVKHVDRICVFSDGKIIEQGTYQYLMAKKEAFFNLATLQRVENERIEVPIELPQNSETEITFDATNSNTEILPETEKINGNITEEVLRLNKPERKWIILGCMAAIPHSASLPFFSILFTDLLGKLYLNDENEFKGCVNLISLFLVLAGIIVAISCMIELYSFGKAGENLTFRVRSNMFSSMLKQEIGWFDLKENSAGVLCSKLSNNSYAIQELSGNLIATVVNSLTITLLTFTIAFYFNWKLTALVTIFLPISIAASHFHRIFTDKDLKLKDNAVEKSIMVAVESMNNIKTVAAFGCEDLVLDHYTKELKAYVTASKKYAKITSFLSALVRSMEFFLYSCGLTYGTKLIIEDGVDYGTILKVNELLYNAFWVITNCIVFIPNIQNGIKGTRSILKIVNRSPKMKSTNTNEISKDFENIIFSNVHFSYPTRANISILKNIDLNLERGKTIAIVGLSGSGKSTIFQLLKRFYDPLVGNISINSKDIKTVNLQKYRGIFGIVSQEPTLFDRTIAENIAYGDNDRNVTIEDIIEAAKAANAHNFISSMPKGYDTCLGARGTQLSGGQKQRIAIARALIKDPKILLLDEATSALDNENEKIVQEALEKAKKNRTCIIIAHRLTTIQNADVIYVLDEGKIVEVGTHETLLKINGLYSNLYKL